MGLGEMMGVKNVKLELKGNYATLADLLEAMKDIQFEAGVPELTKHGIGAVIVFPPVDRNNQVWITGVKGKFTIMRSAEVAGLGNMAKNAVLDTLTDGWSSMSGAFGNKKKRCMELVDIYCQRNQRSRNLSLYIEVLFRQQKSPGLSGILCL